METNQTEKVEEVTAVTIQQAKHALKTLRNFGETTSGMDLELCFALHDSEDNR